MMNKLPFTADSEELFWLAVRYVGNDLSDADRRLFEERLATDIQAGEAVAEAVRLTSGLHTALAPSPQLAPPVAPRAVVPAGRRRWVPVALSAVLLVLTVGLMTAWPQPAAEHVEVVTAELLSRWRLDHRFGLTDDVDQEEDWGHESEIVDESLSAPSWLVSAVRLTAEADSKHP